MTPEAEGGCGVVGLAANRRVEGRYLLEALCQMKNRGNAKGGGAAMAGLSAAELGIPEKPLREDHLLQVAYLDSAARSEVERSHIEPMFEVGSARAFPAREVGLDVRPPEVVAYSVRPKQDVVAVFVSARGLENLSPAEAADEFVFRNSFDLNRAYYASLGVKRAFVLSHARDMLVFKLVGYADDAVRAYGLEDLTAHVWVGHHRYPTKGRVWHPGGAHPFSGMHEALVHNGDFANYHSITRALKQRGLEPLFLTDTEVSVQLFDYLRRTCRYPLEWVFESLAPTTERDFELLSPERRAVYARLRQAHIHGSPDGPWFFILAANPRRAEGVAGYELIGITDTSMLRPAVFALRRGALDIGLIASEKQAIDAVLRALHQDGRVEAPSADLYWNARGGSHTDGGAFVFTARPGEALGCRDKFGTSVSIRPPAPPSLKEALTEHLEGVAARAEYSPEDADQAIEEISRLLDSRRETWGLAPSVRRGMAEAALERVFAGLPPLAEAPARYRRVGFSDRGALAGARTGGRLVVDARGFPPEGPESLARFVVEAHGRGFQQILCWAMTGQRFLGCGLGPRSEGLKLHLYGCPGDYVASGLDGGSVVLHASGQDQLANIMKSGKLVVHGDAGQCFMYGAKGGSVFVLGNAAGRPLINAVGSPRVVINGTALDYLGESFMAGDPHQGGGFVVVNGMEFDPDGALRPQASPYPGGNLFSLASGGALFVRDPMGLLSADQLNGAVLAELADQDWDLVRPYLEENEKLFHVPVAELLTHDGRKRQPRAVYRKIVPRGVGR